MAEDLAMILNCYNHDPGSLIATHDPEVTRHGKPSPMRLFRTALTLSRMASH
jgi:hypothetical protein